MRPTLIDPFLRKIEYLRVSVTDRCDLRCNYCLPKHWDEFNEPDDWLTFAEIERVVAAFVQLGVSRVRLTGGEPLARRELPVLAQQLGRLPNLGHAAALHQAGVTRLNVSLDSLRADRFAEITGGGKLSKVLKGLEVASAAGFAPIKINTVAMRGVNDDEFEDMVQFCTEHGYALRLIETMPVGDTGRAASDTYLDLQGVRESLQKTFELVPAAMPGGGPARYYQVAGTETRVGFITPMSQHFCDTCNRVRLSADGTLYLCLGQEDSVALRPLLRAGISDEALRTTIEDAIARKPERHEFKQKPEKIIRFMSLTGG
ncbi:MAG: cyclic pyranopterin phosphate synthase MoaA [Acidithiobacillales bacterium SG8_45]|nr:MAG: cyclic pyranopterin phosphate synthase MoaA [Acidithiobacillales bacterium SG8_45]